MRKFKPSLVVLAACGGSAPAPVPKNTAVVAERVVIADDAQLGWLGVAPVANRDAGDWRPQGSAAMYLPSRPSKVEPNMTFVVVDAKAASGTVIGVGQPSIPYGCDDGRIDVTALDAVDQVKLAPGVVWMLHPSVPKAWTPVPLAIRAVAASETRRAYVAGPLAIELVRTTERAGKLAIAWNGKPVYTRAFERDNRDGGTTVVDLAEGGIGVLEPIAAWAIAGERGAIVVALLEPTYEGLQMRAALVQEDRGRDDDDMGFNLYQCAF